MRMETLMLPEQNAWSVIITITSSLTYVICDYVIQ